MAILLEGDCCVAALRETEARMRTNVRARPLFGRATGAAKISLRLLEFATGITRAERTLDCDDVWFVLDGEAALHMDGSSHTLRAETGVYIAPGSAYGVENPAANPLVVLSSRCPEPQEEDPLAEFGSSTSAAHVQRHAVVMKPVGAASTAETSPVVRLCDREAVPTGNRWYRVLVDEAAGCQQVTQFVGSIPPGRAPDHFHHYEEVICILEGSGRMWAGESSAPIAAGSCIYLPRQQVHCVENTGAGALRLVGMFYPAGSPAVAYEAEDSPSESREAMRRRGPNA